jgi:hypothetical protein
LLTVVDIQTQVRVKSHLALELDAAEITEILHVER